MLLRMPSKNNMNNIRNLFTRDHKEKVPPDLGHALTLLQLKGYEDLEDRLLSTEPFLRPWSVFRDSVYLLSPDAVPRTTQVIPIGTDSGDGVSRLDVLWFYTQFDEGTLRYDARADEYSAEYTPDSRLYGLIDKGKWRVEEHEKLLYAWLLQEFKVGKGYSPWRFESFELKNICTVWEEVFVPIVNAVRTSYNPMGRRHFGRLALFIEARSPSSLAFPSSNVGIAEGEKLSSTPYRVVSMPKKKTSDAGTTPYYHQEFAQGVLTEKNYDTTEKELRDVYPQYGGLVERPKFKHKMEEWLAEQRARADRRKNQEKHGRVQSFQARVVQRDGSLSSVKQSPRGSLSRRQDQNQRSSSARGDGSPIKRYSDNIKRSFSNAVASMSREEQKSPLHGVRRQLHFPDRTSSLAQDSLRDSMVITPLPRPEQHHQSSDVSVYTSIRNSNPYSGDLQDVSTPQRARTGTNDSTFSPMGQLSAIPRPLHSKPEAGRNVERVHEDHTSVLPKKSYHDVRAPSYEGTDYEREISLTDLHTRRMNEARRPEPARARTPATRLPAPIVPIPYGGPRIASADTPGKSKGIKPLPKPVIPSPPKQVPVPAHPVLSPPKPVAPPVKPPVAAPKSIAWPGPASTYPKATAWPDSPSPEPKTMAWPGFESDEKEEYFPSAVPSKSPERHIRNPRSRQPLRGEEDHDVFRIVSRDNIRAALSVLTRESSAEELTSAMPANEIGRTMSPMKQPLQTYNTHLFPRKDERKDTPVGEWVKQEADRARYDAGGAYELKVLQGGKMDQH
jgi:hypothetical protein